MRPSRRPDGGSRRVPDGPRCRRHRSRRRRLADQATPGTMVPPDPRTPRLRRTVHPCEDPVRPRRPRRRRCSSPPVGAITNGAPDAGEHPYVGELLFYVPDVESSRFDDPGGWFTCTGTLLNSTHRSSRRPLHVRRRQEQRLDDARRRDHRRGPRRRRRQRRLGQLRRGAELRHPAGQLDVRDPGRALRGVDHRPERQQRVAPRHRDAASAVRRQRLLRARRRRRRPVERRPTCRRTAASRRSNWLERYRSQARNAQRFETVGYGTRAGPGQEGVRRRHPDAVAPEARQPQRPAARTRTSSSRTTPRPAARASATRAGRHSTTRARTSSSR